MTPARRCALLVALVLCLRARPGGAAEKVSSATPLASPANTEAPPATREWREGNELVRAFVSSPRPNGTGGAFSAWWGLQASPSPEGYVLKAVTFHLVGDRSCAGSDASAAGAAIAAECRQDMRDERAARWAFRTQGHDDGTEPEKWSMGMSAGTGQLVTSGPAGTSRGVLLCTYAPAPPPPPPAAAK